MHGTETNHYIVDSMGNHGCSKSSKKQNDHMKLIKITFIGIIFGFLVGINFPKRGSERLHRAADLKVLDNRGSLAPEVKLNNSHKIWVPSNPSGAESLPPGIVTPESDLYLHRLWGNPNEDLTRKPKYLVTFTVGVNQKKNIDLAVKKFSENFTITLFHYDNGTTEWDEFEWSRKAIHISAIKQTKWWFAKRFLHPDIVAPYDYIFIWDEDLGVQHFNAEEYIKLVKKHGLEISQPGLEPNNGLVWQMTKRRIEGEVHKQSEEKPGWCTDPFKPPCAGFVEIMAPVFSRKAWRCVWNMIQNDLVHGWGLDFAVGKCVEPAEKNIGVVDTQWIVHQRIPSLRSQGEQKDGELGVRQRCTREWKMFQKRFEHAEADYLRKKRLETNYVSHLAGQ